MQHFAPHPKAAFEGYYSKFDLPSGAHIVLIICSVPNATQLPPHMVSFTYYPKAGSPIFQREHWVADIHHITTNSDTRSFELRVPDLGFMRCDTDSTTTYELENADWTLRAKTSGRTPWSENRETPEGWLVWLPLPLHWHVHSLASPCTFELSIPSLNLPLEDKSGEASVHQEKNWASSFPAAHMWIQAHSPANQRTICLAGGKILGMTAYILAYRSPSLNIDFLPPFSLSVLGISPFMSIDIDWERRAFAISVSGLWRKIEVRAKAPREKDVWFGLATPFPDGHRGNFCTESFLAEVKVQVFKRGWWGSWTEVCSDKFENASLEFAGEYFPERGDGGLK